MYVAPSEIDQRLVFLGKTPEMLVSHDCFADPTFLEMKPY
jgi:hypothetical protein